MCSYKKQSLTRFDYEEIVVFATLIYVSFIGSIKKINKMLILRFLNRLMDLVSHGDFARRRRNVGIGGLSRHPFAANPFDTKAKASSPIGPTKYSGSNGGFSPKSG